MKKLLPLAMLSALTLSACATTNPSITPEQQHAKKVSTFKKLEWLVGTDGARRFMDDPNRPYVPVNNKKVSESDVSRYNFDTSIYEYLGEESEGLIYAVIKEPVTGSYKAGYLYPNGKVAIPFNFGHTNRDHLSSRAFFGGWATVLNYDPVGQDFREAGAQYRNDQYAIIDKSGRFKVQYTAYTDIQKLPYDNFFTAWYIDEKGQKRTSKISTNMKLLSDVAGWSNR